MAFSSPLTYLRHLRSSINSTTLHLLHTGLNLTVEQKQLSNQPNTSYSLLMMWTEPFCLFATLHLLDTPSLRPSACLVAHSADLPQPATTLEPFIPPRNTVVTDHVQCKLKQKNAYDKHASAPLPDLPPGSYVYAKPPPTSSSKTWIQGKVIGSAGLRSYLIDTGVR